MDIQLRPYQEKCIDIIKNKKPGKYLIQMATGLGKTVTFSQVPFKKRLLIVSHRQELVTQPQKFFNCSYGICQGQNKYSDEKVISASIQTLVNRLDTFKKDDFDYIIIDEAHHAAASSYKKIIEYFEPDYLLGFTATPNRGDNIKLSDVFDEIIFERDLKWGILNNFLCGIDCKRVTIDYDLSEVKKSGGDYQAKSLDLAVNINQANDGIADTFYKHARGQTIIFCTSVNHCYEIQKRIEGSKVIDGKTKKEDRENIIKDFTNRKFKCLINCLVFTEGTDIPLIETVIIARPTKNPSLYTQMVGRGLRLYEGKEKLLLIDCVGASSLDLCTAPTLFGLNAEILDKKQQDEIEGDLFDIEALVFEYADSPKTWIKNIKNVEIFKKKNGYDTHNVNYLLMPDGSLRLRLKGLDLTIKKPNELGNTLMNNGKLIPMQKAFDLIFNFLVENYQDDSIVWNTSKRKRWGKNLASQEQINFIARLAREKNIKLSELSSKELNKEKASSLIDHLLCAKSCT